MNQGYYSQIGWVDEYVRMIGGYISVREEDGLLIKIPNEAHKLNSSAVRMLKAMLDGKSVFSTIDRYPDREAVARDIHFFFCDLKALLKGCLHEGQDRRTVERKAFQLPFNTLPVLSEIALTYQCNLACRFCYASCGCSRREDRGEMSTAQVKQVLEIIRHEAKVPSVSFTGGEPTTRPDLPELVAHAKKLEMWTNVITNGTRMIPERVAALKEAGLDSAQVSLEAGTADLHDRIVQRTGAFYKSLQGLENLRSAGIRVHTNTTICGLNRDHLLPIPDLVKSRGMDKFSMNLLMPEGTAVANLDELLVRYSEIGGLVMTVKDHARRLGLEFMWYSPTPMCIFNPVIHGLGNKGCAACDGLLSIAPNGDILPCSSYPQSMGNILKMKGRFQEFWRSEPFRYFQTKAYAHEQCRSCEDLPVCNGGCPLYWRQVGYDELLSRRHESATEAAA